MRRSLKQIFRAIAGFLAVLLLAGQASVAQIGSGSSVVEQQPLRLPQMRPSSSEVVEPATLNDPDELERFLDSFFGEELEQSSAPGAVVSIVKEGQIFFAKGYGYANIDKKIPVDADRTLFRVASLSKLFTTTAAMQLYEQGLIDLDADVSPYLDFPLDNPYAEPITLARIMTHTDGTTKRRIGLAARTEAELQSLAQHLPDHMPPIVRPPGEIYSYSSYSLALLGYLIERITETPFIQYVNQHILQPLDMQRSTFLQPPPPHVANDLAVGYQNQGGEFKPVPYLYLNIYPAAALQTTAIDMAHFMIAHLQLGRYEDQRILESDTARLMHVTQFTNYPGLPGTSYGFRERFINNIRTIGHLGSLRGYSSSITLLPDRNIGIFVASNSFSGIQDRLLGQFFDRYFPMTQEPELAPPTQNVDLSPYIGYYRDFEHPRHTFVKLSGIFEHIRVVANDDNTLTVKTPNLFFFGSPEEKHLVPTDLPRFTRVEDNTQTAFEPRLGKMFAFNPIYPEIGAYVRVPWYETVWANAGVLIFCVIFFLTAAIAWVIYPLIQRLRGKRSPLSTHYGWALETAGIIGILNLIFLVGLPLYLWYIGAWKLAYGLPPVAIALLCIPVITSILALVLPVMTIAIWKQGEWSLLRRSHYSLVTLAAIAFVPFLAYWNLLGFHV